MDATARGLQPETTAKRRFTGARQDVETQQQERAGELCSPAMGLRRLLDSPFLYGVRQRPPTNCGEAVRSCEARSLYCGRTKPGFPCTPTKTTSSFAIVVPLFLPLCQVLTTSRKESPAL